MMPFRISVPASSANLGPGFDSMGLALGLYIHLDVETSDHHAFFAHGSEKPQENHFIWNITEQVAARYGTALPPCKVQEVSEIPLARGLGSSASAIVAGIELANQLGNLQLTNEQKLAFGTEIEGHPDNIAPALFGGLTISTMLDNDIPSVRLHDIELDLIAYIPEVELKTEVARDCLPDTYERNYAARASAMSNLVVAALYSKDYPLFGKMLENDLFHEPFRKTLIPNFDAIREKAKELGAFGTALSGAGPTMLSFVAKGNGETVKETMAKQLEGYQVKVLEIDTKGVSIS
ncbi:homoserine kinase [Oceanobacillus oncorhynchi subsp. incaldanensis]|uniref:homoserine kinase n=1 Tax=Oceanobacillus TaxID=182709 RepID=UPI001868D23D|nr:homoserine kinase [Oceanobacillus oncorhynchi]MDM8100305.1 homoserine kinase [Oceanobacillus oncorhynchi]UUI40882.1 homoserine kinase [Oceanobacillus oncorhynchi]GIO18746.1 homoserine kinase [Oceanobacillus oncorhynchi subsp. incaldanensis]